MEAYIDIHSHILPQIDDGAENFEMSMKMLRTAYADGTEKIILTPHYKPGHRNAGPGRIYALVEEIKGMMEEEGIQIQLYPGNEFYYHSGVFQKLTEGNGCTLGGSSYVLVEFGPMERYGYIRNGVYEALAGGYRPVLAHVERYDSIFRKPERVEELVKMGCYIQVNAGSITGKLGFGIKQFTKRLLRERLVHFAATDAHNADTRKPGLSECAKYLCRRYGEDYAELLLHANPLHVIKDEDI